MDDGDFRSALRDAGLTQTEFSRLTDIPIRTVQNYAAGVRPVPRFMPFLFRCIRIIQACDREPVAP